MSAARGVLWAPSQERIERAEIEHRESLANPDALEPFTARAGPLTLTKL